MKEEIVELIGAEISEDGVLLSYTGERRDIVIPDEVKRIAPHAFARSFVEKVTIPGDIGIVESGTFAGCERLREVEIEDGVVKIADGAFSACPSLSIIHIPETVVIIDDGALPLENDGLVIIARAGSFAYNYAVAHSVSAFESEDDFTALEGKKNSLEYIELDMFGEKIKLSSSAPICYEVEQYYNRICKEFLDTFLNRYNIDEVFEEYLTEAATRVNKNGGKVTYTEVLSLMSEEIERLKHEYRGYRIVLRGELSRDEDIEQARRVFIEKVEQFIDALKATEIRFLARAYVTHEDIIPYENKQKAREISANIIASGKCPEVSVTLSLKLYPYNGELIRYAVRSGVVCDGLFALAKLLGVDFFCGIEEEINKLLVRCDFFDIKSIDNLVRGTLDAVLPEFVWGTLVSYEIYPSFEELDILKGLTTFEEIASAVVKEAEGIKAKLDDEYKRANNALSSAKSIKELESAMWLFEAMLGYGESEDRIKEIKGKIKELKGKKRKRTILTSFVSAVSVFAVLLTALIVYLTSPRLKFEENSDGGYTLVGCNKNKTKIEIPDTHRGKPVTSIGDWAFVNCDSLTSVTIPDSVTSIGELAFYNCTSLTSVTIPNSVTIISGNAFFGCNSVENLSIPSYAISFFEIKNLKNVTVTGGAIYDEMFSGCENLLSVVVGDSITTIGARAFFCCTNLTSVIIGDSVTSIGESAFDNCIQLSSITIPYGVVSIGDNAFYDCQSLTSVTIPDSVTSIGNYAFTGSNKLVSAIIGEGVTSIGEGTFYSCDSLTGVAIPDSVTSIGRFAFEDCESLTEINYCGTEAQWNAITKGNDWDLNAGAYTVNYNYKDE